MATPSTVRSVDTVRQTDLETLHRLEVAAVSLRQNIERRLANGARVESGPLHFEGRKNTSNFMSHSSA